MEREYLQPEGLGSPTDPFTHVIVAGETVYVAGQIALDEDNELVGVGDPARQAEQCWHNIGLALASSQTRASSSGSWAIARQKLLT